MGTMMVFLLRSPAMIAGHIDDVDALEVGSQVAVHEGVQTTDRQTVFHLVAEIRTLRMAVDFAGRMIAVSEHPKIAEIELRSQRLLRPFNHGIDVPLGPVTAH